MSVDRQEVEEQIAALGLIPGPFTWRECAYLHKVLAPGENILAMTSGFLEGCVWLVTVTDKRVLLLDKGLFYGLKQMEFPISRITSVAYRTGLTFGHIEIFASGGTRRIEMVWKKNVSRVASTISGLIGGFRNRRQSSNTDFVSQLERLAELKRGGILTEDEFATQKARILQPAAMAAD
jgi:hypothetical protein